MRIVRFNVRNWYDGDPNVTENINHLYSVENDGGITCSIAPSSDAFKGFEIADIYPAYKLIMMVLMLLIHAGIYTNSGEKDYAEYLKMITYYIVYVNLFNTCFGVRMKKDWNDSIKNVYVYNFSEIPDAKQTQMNPLECIKSSDINLSLQHLTDINTTSEDYNDAFFQQDLNSVTSIAEGFKKYVNNLYNLLRLYKLTKTEFDTIINGIGPTKNPDIIAVNQLMVSYKVNIKSYTLHKLFQRLGLKPVKITIDRINQLIECSPGDFTKWYFYKKTDIVSKIDEIKPRLNKYIGVIDVEYKKIFIPVGSRIKNSQLDSTTTFSKKDLYLKIPLNVLDDDYEEITHLSSSNDISLRQGWQFFTKQNEAEPFYTSNPHDILEFPENHKHFLNICEIG